MLSIETCQTLKVAKGSSVNKTGRKKKKCCGYMIYILDKVQFIK